MTVLALALLAQLAAAPIPASGSAATTRGYQARPVQPVLAFPDPALDDTAAYRGYQTRFFRDAARNTLQLYVDQRSARVVHLMADADNASIGFTTRDSAGRTPAIDWAGPGATVSTRGRTRTFAHQLTIHAPTVHLGWFLLGSMRVERDFQYFQRARDGFATAPYAITEVDRLLAAIGTLPPTLRARHLARLHAPTLAALTARMYPHPVLRTEAGRWLARVQQVTLDGRDTLTLELRGRTADAAATAAGDSVTVRATEGNAVTIDVQISTTARPLTPLTREQIFTADFLRFVEATKARGATAGAGDTAAIRARRMERQVSGVELLVSREKLMAGLPTYATYFGRDMLMTALMMRPIWRHETLEAVIATALRKLAPRGDVSHEEALGDQAVRESAGEYAAFIAAWRERAASGDRRAADSLLARADSTLRTLRVTRENYHMIDDEYQFAIVVSRWLTDPSVPADAKRAFLLDGRDGGGTRVDRLLRALSLVVNLTTPYAESPVTANLIAFSRGEPLGWGSASWRDSGAGYAGGRYPMDINAIWVPHALESVGQILTTLRGLGIPLTRALAANPVLAGYERDPATLARAITTWRGAAAHFLVRRSAADVRAAALARMAAMPEEERGWWQSRVTTPAAVADSLTFLAVSLDSTGAPISVANTDPATALFLGDSESSLVADDTSRALQTVRLFTRAYPAGLFVDRIGPVVANDAYASPTVWNYFLKDPYHGPRVVWGREVNLFLLGVAGRVTRASGPGSAVSAAYVRELREAMEQVRVAVEQSGFHTELWSYGFERGRLAAMRYGSGADIQLWSTTDLAVQYVVSSLPRPQGVP